MESMDDGRRGTLTPHTPVLPSAVSSVESVGHLTGAHRPGALATAHSPQAQHGAPTVRSLSLSFLTDSLFNHALATRNSQVPLHSTDHTRTLFPLDVSQRLRLHSSIRVTLQFIFTCHLLIQYVFYTHTHTHIRTEEIIVCLMSCWDHEEDSGQQLALDALQELMSHDCTHWFCSRYRACMCWSKRAFN